MILVFTTLKPLLPPDGLQDWPYGLTMTCGEVKLNRSVVCDSTSTCLVPHSRTVISLSVQIVWMYTPVGYVANEYALDLIFEAATYAEARWLSGARADL